MGTERKTLSRNERIVPMDEPLPIDVVLQLFRVLVDRAGMDVIVEETPDYVAHSLREKAR